MRDLQVFSTKTAKLAVTLMAVLALGACASAPSNFDSLPIGKTVGAPTGFLQFCHRLPDQCSTGAGAKTEVAPLTSSRALTETLPRDGSISALEKILAGQGLFVAASTTPAIGATDALDYSPTSVSNAMAIAAAAPPLQPLIPLVSTPWVFKVSSAGSLGGRLKVTPLLKSELTTVNTSINRAIKPRSDLDAFGVDNYWALPLLEGPRAEGNCKHYALEKRRRLVEDGVPQSALTLAIVVTPSNEIHAVLVASTEEGDVILDNLTDDIRPWRSTGYRWLVRQCRAACKKDPLSGVIGA